MATTCLWPIKKTINNTITYVENKDKTKISLSDLSNTIDYASNKNKTEEQYYVTGINCDSNNTYQDMMLVKKSYNKNDGILGFHGYQSFKEGEVTPELAHKIGIELANEMWGDKFQVIVTTHLNTNHIHNHFVVNSVSIKDGSKYNYSNSEMTRLRQVNDFICEEHNLSVLEEKISNRKHFDFNRYNNKDNYSTRTQRDVDLAIKNSFSYQDFISNMKNMNYEIYERYGKLSVRHKNMKRNIRIERQFGENYTIDNINRRIIEEVPDKLTNEELTTYNKYKNNYYKNKNSILSLFMYYIFRIKIYEKSPRNYKISLEMRKEIDKLERYNVEIRFMNDNKIDSKEELYCYHEINKESLNNLLESRKKAYEDKSKSNDCSKKKELSLLIDLYNETIRDLQNKVKTCELIKNNHERMSNEIIKLNENNKEYNRF